MPGPEETKQEVNHDTIVQVHNAEFVRINERVKDLEILNDKVIQAVTKIDTSIEFVHKRLDQREAQTEAIIKLGTSVEHMVLEVGKLSDVVSGAVIKITDHEYRLRDVEDNSVSEELKEIRDDIKTLNTSVVNLRNASAVKLKEYFEYGLKAVVIALFLAFLYFLSDGRFGG